MNSDLFRSEVLDFQSTPSAGEIVIAHPIAHISIAVAAAALLAALSAILFFGTYTRHTLIQGVIEPKHGLVKLYAAQLGVATDVSVKEGDPVKKGQVLIQASSVRHNGAGYDIQKELDQRARSRLAALRQELGVTLNLANQEASSTRERLANIRRAKENLSKQLIMQQSRTTKAEAALKQFEELRKSGYLSQYQVSQQESEVIDQQMRLDALKKELIATEGEIDRFEREQLSVPLRRDVAKTQLERGIAGVEGEIAQIVGDSAWSMTAPADGTVTAVTIIPGQTAIVGTPLVSIMPKDSALQAKLFAPSRALGFIKVGSPVKIRIDAFPYQKFGLAKGRVRSIADAPTAPNEFASNTTLMPGNLQAQESLYAIVVELDREYVDAYGHKERLRAGMQLAGDVQLDRRRLYEWLLDPLFTISSR